jgi:hypothetical protein
VEAELKQVPITDQIQQDLLAVILIGVLHQFQVDTLPLGAVVVQKRMGQTLVCLVDREVEEQEILVELKHLEVFLLQHLLYSHLQLQVKETLAEMELILVDTAAVVVVVLELQVVMLDHLLLEMAVLVRLILMHMVPDLQ